MRKPAMMAVYNPRAGSSPEAIANAIAKGSAITPTVRPATASFLNALKVYPFAK